MPQFLKITTILIALGMLLVGRGFAEQNPNTSKMEKLAQRLDSAPTWSSMTPDDLPVKGSELVAICEDVLSQLKESEIQTFVSFYMNQKKDPVPVERWGRVFIFNRMATKVPEWDYIPRGGRFGSWGGKIDESGRTNVLFPLEITNGKIAISKTCGFYAGPLYRGIEELAFFAERYGYRDFSKKSGPLSQKGQSKD